jgi:Fur family transcriptional regulator, ferric uptake regulator
MELCTKPSISGSCARQGLRPGLKATAGRVALLHLLESSRKPLAVPSISKKLDLNVVSVYRALDSLAKASLVRQGSDGRVSHFTYALNPHHHHMICTDCGYTQACRAC